MKLQTHLLLSGILTFMIMGVQKAYAYTEPSLVDVIFGLAPSLTTVAGTETGEMLTYIGIILQPTVNVIAMLVMLVSGITLAFAQNESELGTARNTILASLGAIFAVNISGPLANALFKPDGQSVPQLPIVISEELGVEVLGLISWVEVPLATVAVLMIIISGLRAIFAIDTDGALGQLRRTIFAIIGGFTLIAIKFAIVESITETGRPEGGGIMDVIIFIANRILGFVALIAFIMLIVAGLMMIFNVGNDEQYTKARNLILRVIIGLLVIIASFAIINAVFIGASANLR